MPGKFLHQYEIMFNKATADLTLSFYALALEDKAIDMDIIFFHLQHAAEKYLKCLLSFHGVHYEKIHDIKRLLGLCLSNEVVVPAYVEKLVELNPYAVEGRYAVVADDMAEADVYVELLNKFKLFVAGVIDIPEQRVDA